MESAEIAKIVLDKRSSLSPIVIQSEISEKLGPDGFAEALNKGWLQADITTGYLAVTHDMGKVGDMQALVDTLEKVEAPKAVINESRSFFRKDPLYEIGYPSSYSDRTQDFKVGDPVTVSQEGKPYSATIGSLDADGRASLNYTGSIPPDAKRLYLAKELGKVGATGDEEVAAASPTNSRFAR